MRIRARHVGGDSVYFHACYFLGKKFIKHIDKKDGDKRDDDYKSSAYCCTGHSDLDLVR